MKKVLGVILGGLLLLPVVSNAADAQKAADNKKPVNSWTCEDFLAVDESFQPTAVGFAEALNNKNKPEYCKQKEPMRQKKKRPPKTP